MTALTKLLADTRRTASQLEDVQFRRGMESACDLIEEGMAAVHSLSALSAEPNEDLIAEGVKALLQCTQSELEDYSPKLMDGYEEDVRRVYRVMLAAIQDDRVGLVRKALEAAAELCGSSDQKLEIGRCCAAAIRAIDPSAITNEASK